MLSEFMVTDDMIVILHRFLSLTHFLWLQMIF